MREDVWMCVSTCNEQNCLDNLPLWHEMGFKLAVLMDRVRFDVPTCVDRVIMPWDHYAGFAQSNNYLMRHVVPPDVQVVGFMGDDTVPDDTHSARDVHQMMMNWFPNTFGILHCTWDPHKNTKKQIGFGIMGRAFEREWNHGLGPNFPGYQHFFNDNELLHTALKYPEAYKADPTLKIRHVHWTTKRGIERKPTPHHGTLMTYFSEDERLYKFRESMGWPGHTPLRYITK